MVELRLVHAEDAADSTKETGQIKDNSSQTKDNPVRSKTI